MTPDEKLRSLAERPCPRCKGSGVHPAVDRDLGGSGVTNHACETCNGTGYEFAVLRGEHEWDEKGAANTCRRCGWSDLGVRQSPHENPPPYCLRTDLGSIVRAAADAGPGVLGRVCAAIALINRETGIYEPEDAAANAFWDACWVAA